MEPDLSRSDAAVVAPREGQARGGVHSDRLQQAAGGTGMGSEPRAQGGAGPKPAAGGRVRHRRAGGGAIGRGEEKRFGV